MEEISPESYADRLFEQMVAPYKATIATQAAQIEALLALLAEVRPHVGKAASELGSMQRLRDKVDAALSNTGKK